MGFALTASDYAQWIARAYQKIHENGDYITSLDAATGDGDHWINLNMGFEKLVSIKDALASKSLFEAFKSISMTMMSVIGGSGGVLYGSAYMEAAKAVKDLEVLDSAALCNVLAAMLDGIMKRGKSQPGMKTMIDALNPAVECYKDCIARGESEAQTLKLVKKAAEEGALSTKDMEAVRGRAYYQADRGVGHLDPGAITMFYQIETLMDYIADKMQDEA
ncbi:MAG: dihydroxyacetone kinase subunit DhaL [Oscillospiraceae bacterium]|nr:dihydroxyacetone kinase subunit DhaL [Oscillospiraceae bacterium]